MSKELTLLEALKLLKSDVDVYNKQKRDAYTIIETALKDSEKYKTVYPLMEAKLDKVSDEKLKLKEVLEIIKKKEVDFHIFSISANCKHYNFMIDNRDRYLTQEEFNLLKEESL